LIASLTHNVPEQHVTLRGEISSWRGKQKKGPMKYLAALTVSTAQCIWFPFDGPLLTNALTWHGDYFGFFDMVPECLRRRSMLVLLTF
jgi:hypothetical protein